MRRKICVSQREIFWKKNNFGVGKERKKDCFWLKPRRIDDVEKQKEKTYEDKQQ